jgi:outer membrane lipoprotein SlyB
MKWFIASIFTALMALTAYSPPANADTCYSCGRIQKIETVTGHRSTTGGMIIGGIAGGLLGNQVGKGNGKKAATVAGAAGGAYAGKKIAENSEKTQYRVTVLMNDGRVRTVTQSSVKYMRVGDPVTVTNGKAKLRQ